jgi:hypothetical protein
MSQTIRSHVTNHPVTCHKPIASHRTQPGNYVKAQRPEPLLIRSHATQSLPFFILTTTQMREIHQNNHHIHLEESVMN